jgi:glycosyltransferase involved in cell wall biosynthesis
MTHYAYKICGLICAYDEERSLKQIISRTDRQVDEVVVVDDGSKDKTFEIADKSGARVLRHAKNLGKGAALRTGFNYFLNSDCDLVVTLDADGQHMPEDIPRFMDKIGDYDFLVGKRSFDAGNSPFSRRLGNYMDSAILSAILGQKVYDPQNGFRMFRRSSLEGNVETNMGSGFPFEIELLIRLLKRGKKAGWVDISTIYDDKIKSHIRPMKHVKDSMKIYCDALRGRIS